MKTLAYILSLGMFVSVAYAQSTHHQERKLFHAVKKGNVAEIQTLIKQGVNVDTRRHRLTALHYAAIGGSLQIIDMLLQAKADVNAADKYGETPLHVASYKGHTEVVRHLLSAGANIHAETDKGDEPLHFAAGEDHLEVLKVLIAHDADVNLGDSNGLTALHTAAVSHGSLEVIELLLEKGADVNLKTKKGETALDFAQKTGHLNVVEVLKAAGTK